MRDDELVARLESLGRSLVADGSPRGAGTIADRVLDHIEGQRGVRRHRLLVAGAALLAVVTMVAVPGSRRAVARWFGLAGVELEVDPELTLTDRGIDGVPPGPGETRIVEVGDRRIVVSVVPGALDDMLIRKTVGASDQVQMVDVAGRPGLWIAGEPHEVAYRTPDREVMVERLAANTLLWQDGDVLYRVEGFERLDDALAFALDASGT